MGGSEGAGPWDWSPGSTLPQPHPQLRRRQPCSALFPTRPLCTLRAQGHLQVAAQVHRKDVVGGIGDEAGAHAGRGVVQVQDEVKGLARGLGPQQSVQLSGSCHLIWVIRVGPGPAGAGMGVSPPTVSIIRGAMRGGEGRGGSRLC